MTNTHPPPPQTRTVREHALSARRLPNQRAAPRRAPPARARPPVEARRSPIKARTAPCAAAARGTARAPYSPRAAPRRRALDAPAAYDCFSYAPAPRRAPRWAPASDYSPRPHCSRIFSIRDRATPPGPNLARPSPPTRTAFCPPRCICAIYFPIPFPRTPARPRHRRGTSEPRSHAGRSRGRQARKPDPPASLPHAAHHVRAAPDAALVRAAAAHRHPADGHAAARGRARAAVRRRRRELRRPARARLCRARPDVRPGARLWLSALPGVDAGFPAAAGRRRCARFRRGRRCAGR